MCISQNWGVKGLKDGNSRVKDGNSTCNILLNSLKIVVDHIVFGIELITIISLLVFGLGYSFGNLFNIQSKKFKAEIKYIEGKYHRLRQEKKDEAIELAENSGGFDINSILSNPTLSGIIQNVVQNNPDLIKNIVDGLTNKKSMGFDVGSLK